MAKRKKNENLEKTRNIYFFRVDAGADADGKPKLLDLRPATKKLDRLTFEDGGRYQSIGDDGDRLCTWTDSLDYPIKLRFGSIRVSGLPQAEANGILSDLNLAIDQGLCEASHICVFDNGIVGVENNFYGPRIPRLANYLQYCVRPMNIPFVLEQLIRGDAAEMLLGKNGIRSLELRIRRSWIPVVAEADETLGVAFEAAANAGNAETVAVILRPEPYKRTNLRESLLDTLKSIVGRNDLRQNAIRLNATLLEEATQRAVSCNLLEDKFVGSKKILRVNARSRVLDRSDAYAKIIETYEELKDDLEKAAGVATDEQS